MNQSRASGKIWLQEGIQRLFMNLTDRHRSFYGLDGLPVLGFPGDIDVILLVLPELIDRHDKYPVDGGGNVHLGNFLLAA